MEETKNHLFTGHAPMSEGRPKSTTAVHKKIVSSSAVKSEVRNSVTPTIASEDGKKHLRKEIRSVYTRKDPIVFVNTTVTTVSDSNAVRMDVDFAEKDSSEISATEAGVQKTTGMPSVERIPSSQIRQLVIPATSQQTTVVSGGESPRKRRHTGTIVWEPLLVPSEMDGKIEMITAMKRVDSNYISAPRLNPRKHEITMPKETDLHASSKMRAQQGHAISPKATYQKSPVHSESKPSGSRKEMSAVRQCTSDGNFNVQIVKQIAEKEASILKEIERAMKEAADLKSRNTPVHTITSMESKPSSGSSKPIAVSKVATAQNIKKRKTKETHLDSSEDSEQPKESNTFEDFHGNSEADTEDFTISTLSSSSKDTCCRKDSPMVNQTLEVPETMFTSPASSTTTSGTAAKDAVAVGKILAMPANAKQKSSEASSGAVQRIVLLTKPTHAKDISAGVPPLVPFLSKPVSDHNAAEGTAKANEESGVRPSQKKGNLGRTKISPAPKRGKNSHSAASADNISVPSTSQNTQPVITKKLSRSSMKQINGSHHVPAREGSNSATEERALSGTSNQSIVPIAKNPNPLDTVVGATVNGKVATRGVTSCGKDMEEIDCNGEFMDSDTETVTVARDRCNKVRRAGEKKLLSSDEKFGDTLLLKGKENTVDEPGQLSRSVQKAARSKLFDPNSSEDMLESRLQRIEQLYSEVAQPPKSRISFTHEEYSKVRDAFRNNIQSLHGLRQSASYLLGHRIHECAKYVHASCQTEVITENPTEKQFKSGNEKSDCSKAGHALCRLCGGFFMGDSLIGLFGTISIKRKLLSMLSSILPQSAPVGELDGLPQQICGACADKLSVCYNIITQFLQADKELKRVLQEEKGVVPDSVKKSISPQEKRCATSEGCSQHLEEKSSAAAERETVFAEKTPSQESKSPTKAAEGESLEEQSSEGLESSVDVTQHGEKRACAEQDSERTNAAISAPNHKHKRKRSISPKRSGQTHNADSAASKPAAACIDLSRLDPEFNDGFVVEWCLDEETIRSSLVPEEDIGNSANDSAPCAEVSGSSEGGISPEKAASTSGVGYVELPADVSDSLHREGSHVKENDSLGSEMPKHTDEGP